MFAQLYKIFFGVNFQHSGALIIYKMIQIGIIGGGINGFCSGVQIVERLGNKVEVTIISEHFTPNTTGDGSAGLWVPFLIGNTPIERTHKWSKGMHDFLKTIWLSGDAGEAGVCLLPVIRATTKEVYGNPFWSDIVYGCRHLSQNELSKLNVGRTKEFTDAVHFITYTSEPVKLLPYLAKRFQNAGGRLQCKKIEKFAEFVNNSNYDVIINCTGLGSKFLLNDNEMHSIRGQVSRTKANWMYYVFFDDDNYVIPNSESVVLGGTYQIDDYNTKPTKEDKDFIYSGCVQLIPGLKNSEILMDWVGLRPGRSSVRLEREDYGKKIVIHNYGHGGCGITLSWGCGMEILEILINSMKAKL